MALFTVLALKDSQVEVDAAITREFPEDSYLIENGRWIVNADLATTKQVSMKLVLNSSHLVFALRGYYGFARPDLWEWLAAQSEKANA